MALVRLVNNFTDNGTLTWRKNAIMSFATAINCMDGRVQGAVRKFMKNQYNVRFVDKITDAGPVKILAERLNHHDIERFRKLLEISILHHHSMVVAIAAHHDCAGNPVSKEAQICQLKQSQKTVQDLTDHLGVSIEIILIWINENCMPEQVDSLCQAVI